jgi:hypothetical protein
VIGCAFATLESNNNEDENKKDVTSKNKMDTKRKFDQVKELLACILVNNFYARHATLGASSCLSEGHG